MATTKKLLLAVLLIFAVALGAFAMVPPRASEFKAHFDRVEEGMPKVEVDQIFGREGKPWVARRKTWLYWQGDDGSRAYVLFNDEYVRVKEWAKADETVLDKIRGCLCRR